MSSTGDCDRDRESLTSQPVSTSHRPVSSSHPVTEHSRHDVPRSAAAHVTTFQITPTLRQRAFPRTNPAYVGTYRRDRPPAYRRIDSATTTTSLGVASELRPTSPAAVNNGTRRPNSDGVQRALIQHTGDVVYRSNTGRRIELTHRIRERCAGCEKTLTVMIRRDESNTIDTAHR